MAEVPAYALCINDDLDAHPAWIVARRTAPSKGDLLSVDEVGAIQSRFSKHDVRATMDSGYRTYLHTPSGRKVIGAIYRLWPRT